MMTLLTAKIKAALLSLPLNQILPAKMMEWLYTFDVLSPTIDFFFLFCLSHTHVQPLLNNLQAILVFSFVF